MSVIKTFELFRQIPVKLVATEESLLDECVEWSGFLKFCNRMNAETVLGNAVEDLFKTHKQAPLWPEVTADNGKFRFELATELPFYLPVWEDKHEYQLQLEDTTFTICLRMVRAYCGGGFPPHSGLDYFLAHRKYLPGLAEKFPGGLHPVPIKTFITRKFEAEGSTAESVMQQNLNKWREAFLEQIDFLTETFRTLDAEAAKYLIPTPSMASFPIFWLLPEGEDGRANCVQILGGYEYGTFTPQCRLKGSVCASISDALKRMHPTSAEENAFGLARTYLNFGHLNLAIVQICVGCEIALSQAYQKFMLSRGVSDKALQDNRKEITFSQLLNIHVFAMIEYSKLSPHASAIAKLNWARKVRNDIVHEGRPQSRRGVTQKTVNEAMQAADELRLVIRLGHTDLPKVVKLTSYEG